MNRIIFSDTHLTTKFDPQLFKRLTQLIEPVDQVIINGDFWDGYSINFDQFLNSEWQRLFPLLKRKQAIYLFGNHDAQSFSDHRVDQFSVQASEFFETQLSNNQKLICYHGHQSCTTIDNYLPFVTKTPFLNDLAISTMSLADRILGAKVWRWKNSRQNQKQHLYATQKYPDSVVVNGHSHLPQKESSWLNCGMINYSRESYIEINQSDLKLITNNWT